jgi:hypothetical protein
MRTSALVLFGAVLGGALEYVYLNTATIEVLAANADGVPLWSWWQVPFALPGACAGALVGVAVAVAIRWRWPTRERPARH